MILLGVPALLLLQAGCASLRSVSVTPVPMESGTEIETVVESPLIVLGFRGDHHYVDEVVGDLKKQCSGGRIQGILTTHERIGWLVAHKNRITASARCIR